MTRPIGKLDLAVFVVVILVLFLVFQHGDLHTTLRFTQALADGHVRDFYDWNVANDGNQRNYLPSTYILFAVWGLPLKILGANFADHHLWFKLLTTLCWMGSAWLVYKLGELAGFVEENRRRITILWLTSPLAIFSQFIFGQYDIFTLFFTLLALYYYFHHRLIAFTLLIGLASTFKYFPLFLFVPLIALVEKNPIKLIGWVLLYSVIPLLEIVPYYHSVGFQREVCGFGIANRIFDAYLSGTRVYLFFFIWSLICLYCYLKDPADGGNGNLRGYNTVSLCFLVVAAMFASVFWHPQWLLFATPFAVLVYFPFKKLNEFLLLDILMMGCFVAFVVLQWPGVADQVLFGCGILGDRLHPKRQMMSLIPLKQHLDLYRTVFTAILVLPIVYRIAFRTEAIDPSLPNNDEKTFWLYVRLRFLLGLSAFVVPATLTLIR